MLALVTPQGNTTRTILEKVEALQARFYSTIEVDLLDIEDTSFLKGSFPPNPIAVS
jgi:hypothetical protein